ncbi:AraC family transcriptional regulator [Bremerella alba]|uniref:Xylose operon regulatory protein n=1 Tax=Bremerella alba TaxID=980252 RepID=A0A7V8V2C0_9BACT|nr:DNA-binding transcriptional regulator [Bremerella alba]MBA2113625.1 Xylose operon regulatory protein [Bremerella alba]
MIQPRKEVALLIETSNEYARGLLDGVVRYMEEYQRWSIFLPEQGRGAKPPKWLKQWNGDGIIARVETPEIAAALKPLNIPIVDVSAARLIPELPWVETDDKAISEMAVEHLLQRGFSHFAFCGDSTFAWSKLREKYFVEALAEHGHGCHVLDLPTGEDGKNSTPKNVQKLDRWIERLPQPIGIMSCFDIRGQLLLEACRELEIDVPRQVAVIGVDNDRLLCDLCSPPLSSVIPDSRRTGFEAARMLDFMMKGQTPKEIMKLIPPLGIATRRSTDVLATEDPLVGMAMQFIREHACDGINVGDVLKAVDSTRRILEYRFKQITGQTPHEAIVHQRLDKVRQLLHDTDLSIGDIADRAGFEHVEYMSATFRKKTGLSPTAYRRKVQPN